MLKKLTAGALLAASLVAVPTMATAAPAEKAPVKDTYLITVVEGAEGGLANAVTKNPNYVFDAELGGYLRQLTVGQAAEFAAEGTVVVAESPVDLPAKVKPVKVAKGR